MYRRSKSVSERFTCNIRFFSVNPNLLEPQYKYRAPYEMKRKEKKKKIGKVACTVWWLINAYFPPCYSGGVLIRGYGVCGLMSLKALN